jgi:regulatory protein
MRERPTRRSDPWADLTRLLRERPRSASEVRLRLARRGHDGETIEETIRSAIDVGLLDDRAFAKLWVTDRLWHHPLSRAALEQELREKGIDRSIAAAEIEAQYPAVREIEVARDLAAARFERLRGIDPERRSHRVANFLMRRGFRRGLAIDVIRQIEKEAADE